MIEKNFLGLRFDYESGFVMNVKTLSKVFWIGCCVLMTSCARDPVTRPQQDWSIPLVVYGRMLDEETLAEMPSYERNQEVCKRTDAAFRRVDLLNDIEDRIAVLGAELNDLHRESHECRTVKVADCINCTPYRIEQCSYSAEHFMWDSTKKNRDKLIAEYKAGNRIHLDAHRACVDYIVTEGLTKDEVFTLHKSALEPPKFLPTPTYPELEMAEMGWEAR